MRKTLIFAALLLLGACSSTDSGTSPASGRAQTIEAATSKYASEMSKAGGAVVTIDGKEVRVTADLSGYDIARGTALHFMLVDNTAYIDATLAADSVTQESYVEGTAENLLKMGVSKRDLEQNSARLKLLMSLPSTSKNWLGSATDLSAVGESSIRLTVPASNLPDSEAAGFSKDVDLVFSIDKSGQLTSWGVFDEAGQTVSVSRFEKVELLKPTKPCKNSGGTSSKNVETDPTRPCTILLPSR